MNPSKPLNIPSVKLPTQFYVCQTGETLDIDQEMSYDQLKMSGFFIYEGEDVSSYQDEIIRKELFGCYSKGLKAPFSYPERKIRVNDISDVTEEFPQEANLPKTSHDRAETSLKEG